MKKLFIIFLLSMLPFLADAQVYYPGVYYPNTAYIMPQCNGCICQEARWVSEFYSGPVTYWNYNTRCFYTLYRSGYFYRFYWVTTYRC